MLGLIIGFLNVTAKETNQFLLVSAVLVIISFFGLSTLGLVSIVGEYLEQALRALIVFIVPAVVVVALKTIYAIEKS